LSRFFFGAADFFTGGFFMKDDPLIFILESKKKSDVCQEVKDCFVVNIFTPWRLNML
jgi:hypothetical protein